MSKHKDINKISNLYRVTFREYTNCLHNTVSTNEKEIGKSEYVECDKDGSLIIRESEFDFYKRFGNGIATMTYLGFIYEE